MITAPAPDTMSRISHAQQHAIFSKYSWTTEGRIRVRATHSSEPLLKLAGVRNPVALEYYNLPAKRDLRGFLVLDEDERAQRPPVTDSDASLFEPGGLFSRQAHDQGTDPDHEREIRDASGKVVAVQRYHVAPDTERELAALCELPATRTFEIPTGPHSKIRVQVIAFEDESLPAPIERERWTPSKPTDVQIHAAVSALHLSRRLADLEQI